MPQGVLPFKYKNELKGSGLTAPGGLPVYLDMSQAMGLSESIDRRGNCKMRRRPGGPGPQGPGSPNISKIISMCWMNLPFGRNHPAYLKFVVSKSFAIASGILKYGQKAGLD
jgi:hypothetical protein